MLELARPGTPGNRPRSLAVFQGGTQSVALEEEQGRVVLLPGGGRQARLEADLVEQLPGIPLAFDRDTGQKQPVRLAADHLHAVLADGDGLQPILTLGFDPLRTVEEPNFHLQMV